MGGYSRFQSPIHGSPTKTGDTSSIVSYTVSIPYTRVTNRVTSGGLGVSPQFQSPIHGSPTECCILSGHKKTGFNPLYTGHQRECCILPGHERRSFNPLYTGHQQNMGGEIMNNLKCFNPLYTGHQLNSFPVIVFRGFVFQSPIHGSPTLDFRHFVALQRTLFQSPIHGSPTTANRMHQPRQSPVSIPYTRVTNKKSGLLNRL